MTAIDLYSGAGGWTLGLKLAGVEVVGAYEIWGTATKTYGLNNGHLPDWCDIRTRPIHSYPSVDLVVGSPPCQQFSTSNRGAGGDVAEGLRDVVKFLRIVQEVKPAAWVLENVPRLMKVIAAEEAAGRFPESLSRLLPERAVVDCSDFGLPQSRKRFLAGCFGLDELLAMKGRSERPTLHDVLRGLDPNYGEDMAGDISGQECEEPFNWEERRVNEAAKRFHPIYNGMSFPDRRERPSRTVTATCTRSSRESIVVEEADGFRRLTLRERATLQGFPLRYEFRGTYGDRMTQIGNAFPPPMAYHVGLAVQGKSHRRLPDIGYRHVQESDPPVEPPRPRRKYPEGRRFTAAIPSLRFKSGMGFELSNAHPGWGVRLRIKGEALKLPAGFWGGNLPPVEDWFAPPWRLDNLQQVWSGRSEDGPHPFNVVDWLDLLAQQSDDALGLDPLPLLDAMGLGSQKLYGLRRKVARGVLLGSWFNKLIGI